MLVKIGVNSVRKYVELEADHWDLEGFIVCEITKGVVNEAEWKATLASDAELQEVIKCVSGGWRGKYVMVEEVRKF